MTTFATLSLLYNGTLRITCFHIPTTTESSSCARTSCPTNTVAFSKLTCNRRLSTKTLLVKCLATQVGHRRMARRADRGTMILTWMTCLDQMPCPKMRQPSSKTTMAQATQRLEMTTANAQHTPSVDLFPNGQQDTKSATHGSHRCTFRSNRAALRGRVTDATSVST
jgi:hypothetical protein